MSKTYRLVLCALFAALIAIGAFIKIPVPYVPMTLQVLFVLLAGILLGEKLGALSVIVYLALGLVGLPVFTGGGGPAYVLQPSFGYLIGFAVGAFAAGLIAKKGEPSIKRYLVASFAGVIAIYLLGVPYCYLINHLYLKNDTGIWVIVLHGFLMTLPGDIIKCIICAVLGKRLVPVLRKKGV